MLSAGYMPKVVNSFRSTNITTAEQEDGYLSGLCFLD
jgi:hypothetical protein